MHTVISPLGLIAYAWMIYVESDDAFCEIFLLQSHPAFLPSLPHVSCVCVSLPSWFSPLPPPPFPQSQPPCRQDPQLG